MAAERSRRIVGKASIASGTLALLLLLTTGLPGRAKGHDRTTSFSIWEIEGSEVSVTARFSAIDVTRFEWGQSESRGKSASLRRYLVEKLRLTSHGIDCQVTADPEPVPAGAERLAFKWRLSCPSASSLVLRSSFLLDVAPAHLHFARVRRNGDSGHERVLSNREPSWVLDGPPEGNSAPTGEEDTSFTGFLQLGVEHILGGYDHLAFVLALLLVGGTLRELARVVTGFTLAHSITLGLAALGYVQPAAAPVEAIIGLSIALVAAENVWLMGSRGPGLPALILVSLVGMAVLAVAGHGRLTALSLLGLAVFVGCYFGLLARVHTPHSLRWAIAFLFGLVHGFGFASVLGEAGLPPGRAAMALLGFNLGVEAGQLLVVGLLWPALRWATQGSPTRHERMVQFGSAAVAALGTFWFVGRCFG